MPLTYHAGLIAIASKDFRKRFLLFVESRLSFSASGAGRIGDHAIDMSVFAGEERGAAGSAESVGGKAVLKTHAFVGNAVNIGRVDETAAVATESAEGNALPGDPENIRPGGVASDRASGLR